MNLDEIIAARVHRWLDTNVTVDGVYPVKYGVEVRYAGRWAHLAVNGKAAIFDTAQLAQANADEIMKQVQS